MEVGLGDGGPADPLEGYVLAFGASARRCFAFVYTTAADGARAEQVVVRFDDGGALDFSAAYAEGIGSWDKRMVLYAYQDFADGVDARVARQQIIEETIQLGYKYIGDSDSRSVSTAHPDGNVWDNGSDAIAELEHLLKVRDHALERFSANNIRTGRPLATLEEAIVFRSRRLAS